MARLTPLALIPSLLFAFEVEARAQCEALLFDGIDDVCTVIDSNNDFDLGLAMTVESWVRVDVAQSGGMFVGAHVASGGGAWTLGVGLGNPLDGVWSVSVPNTDAVFAQGAVQVGTWQHFAATYDGVTMDIYVDGAFVSQSAHGTGGPTSDAVSLIFGQFPVVNSGLHLNGALDEVRIWNVVRTANEIQQSYNTELTGNEPGLVGYYKFEEGGGDDILDSSPQGNHGYLGTQQGADAADPTRIATGIPFCGSGTIGQNFECPQSNPNSTTLPGLIAATGSLVATDNDVTLSATQLPNNQFGYFLNSMLQNPAGFVPPGSQGRLCIGPQGIGRYNLPNQIYNTGAAGSGSLVLDLTNTPIPIAPFTTSIQGGETWYFTSWYRDNNPGSTSNFTDAVCITFQ